MELYIASLYQISEGETTLVGVYSNSVAAIMAGEKAIQIMIEKDPALIDWDYEAPEERRYYDGWTLYITKATLDQDLYI